VTAKLKPTSPLSTDVGPLFAESLDTE